MADAKWMTVIACFLWGFLGTPSVGPSGAQLAEGPDFEIFNGAASWPGVAMAPSGEFLVVWSSFASSPVFSRGGPNWLFPSKFADDSKFVVC